MCAVPVQAEFVLQGSYGVQMSDRIARLSRYEVKYEDVTKSPYDVSMGYLFSFKDVAVMPVMLEGKKTTVESYLNPDKMTKNEIAPLEVLVKPGLRLTDSDVYMILGYQLGTFKQHIETNGHEFELRVKPNFYGVGYAKSLSDYLDYLAEVKVYYHSNHSYAFDFEKGELDSNLVISDTKLRFGFRVKF